MYQYLETLRGLMNRYQNLSALVARGCKEKLNMYTRRIFKLNRNINKYKESGKEVISYPGFTASMACFKTSCIPNLSISCIVKQVMLLSSMMHLHLELDQVDVPIFGNNKLTLHAQW